MQRPVYLKRMAVTASLLALFGSGLVHAQNAAPSGSTPQTESSGASGATAEKAGGTSLGRADQELVRQMAQANLAEIETGKIALSKTKDEQVKVFAQRMIDDHTLAQQDLEQLASAKGMTLPATPDRKHRNAAEKLGALEGEKFDKAYLAQGHKDHRDTHKLLQRAQQNAKDADLKALAAKTLPIITQHQTLVQTVSAEQEKSTQAVGSSDSSSKASGAGTKSSK